MDRLETHPQEAEEQKAPSTGRFVRGAMLKGLIGFLLGFTPFLIIKWTLASSHDAKEILAYVAWVFGIGGFLAGIGIQCALTFGKPSSSEPTDLVKEVGERAVIEPLLGPLGPLLGVGKILFWFARKDFTKQEPGRGRRAVVGALGLGIVAFFVIGLLLFVGFETDLLSGLGICSIAGLVGALVGAVIGLLSDSL